jgi:hypothetical protein
MTKSKIHRIPIRPLQWESKDPLTEEHELVSQLLSQTLNSGWQYYKDLDLGTTEAGRQVIAADPTASARLVLALVAHLVHYDGLKQQVQALAKDEMERINWHFSPEWEAVWFPRTAVEKALRRVMRRKLPFSRVHLMALADWIAASEWVNDSHFPLKAFVAAVESHGQIEPGETELRGSLSRVAKVLRSAQSKEMPKLAHRIEDVLGKGASVATAEAFAVARVSAPDPTQPAPVGSPHVLVQLKQFLGVLPEGPAAAAQTIGFDRFVLRADSPLKEEHELINMFLPEVVGTVAYHDPGSAKTPVWREMLSLDALGKGRLLLAAAERCANSNFAEGRGGLEDYQFWQSQHAVQGLFRSLLSSKPELSRDGAFDVVLFLSALSGYQWTAHFDAAEVWFGKIEQMTASAALTPGERHVLHRFRVQSVRTCPFGRPSELVLRVTRMLGDQLFLAVVPGEAWADAVNSDLAGMPAALREKWVELLQHAVSATGTRPSAKWLKEGKAHLNSVGLDRFSEAAQRWFPLVNVPRTISVIAAAGIGSTDPSGTIHPDNATCLRGLLWMLPETVSPDLIRAVGAITVSAYRKIPGIGPRAVKVGNAGVYALSRINDPLAVGQLALLKVKVKSGSAQKEIEKAFDAAAERSGLPRDEIEEMSVPTYGLTEVGVGEEPMGDFTARLSVTGTTSTELLWVKPDGKVQRAVPASVKQAHKDDLKELQAAAKDIQKMLPAQRERIDGLFVKQKTWPLGVWRERYLNHPLVGTLARRILWEFKRGERNATAIWFRDRLVDLDLRPVDLPEGETTVQLWHPIGKSTEEVMAWRSWLEAQQIQQPFKQAHRELYLLTDAERNTRTYSNRYAAHVLKQHQFNALCALRGWKNKLRLMVDDAYPPAALPLPQWGLRAEFWVEGLGSDYGADTNESGVFLHLSTDQVRFYRVDAAQRMAHAGGGGYHPGYRADDDQPVPLAEIPPLVFSEVMRDVDMFVGVASVGNDPTWADGGPQGRYQEYWQSYSFGDLNASAKTRKEVLERLVPKLKFGSRCAFLEKFLVVKGSLRTYKIHLGSGNILMEPNDQYLCIVPRQSEAAEGGVLLPFEGDRTLSIILSKAFLLAEDEKIDDETITRQIQGK